MIEDVDRYWSVTVILLLTISSLPLVATQTGVVTTSFSTTPYHPSNLQNITHDYWPTDGWRNRTLAEEGMSQSVLEDMLTIIDTEDYPIDSVLIVKNGYLVFENYPSGLYNPTRKHDLHSVTKSFTSTLIGIALQQGFLESVNQHLLDFFPEYTIGNPSSAKEDITLEHLLTMSAGLDWDESSLPYTDPEVNDLGGMMVSDDVVQYVLDKPMLHYPGAEFLYSGGVSTLLGAIIQQISDYTTIRFAEKFLFDPLGFGYTTWYIYPGGWYNTQGGLRANAHDMAKLGFLYLNNGTWNGTQILSADYVTNATTPHFTDLYFPPEYAGYGWQWWLAPDMRTFMAAGRMGQKIIVSREHDMVAVFTAHVGDLEYDPGFDLYNDYILQSVLQGPDTNQTGTEMVLPPESALIVIGTSGLLVLGAIVYIKRKSG